MTMPERELQVRPRAVWYAVPVVMWAAAAVLFVLAVVAIAHVVNAGVDRVPAGGSGWQVAVPANGLTFYTTDANSTADCVLTSSDGTRTPLETLDVTIEITINGPTYHGLGVTPSDLAPGRYLVTCSDIASGARLGTGPRVDVTALATRALWGLVLPMVLGVAGLVVLIVLIVKRHSSRSRIRTMNAYAASGYGSAWNQTQGPAGPGAPGGRVDPDDHSRLDSNSSPPPPPPPART